MREMNESEEGVFGMRRAKGERRWMIRKRSRREKEDNEGEIEWK